MSHSLCVPRFTCPPVPHDLYLPITGHQFLWSNAQDFGCGLKNLGSSLQCSQVGGITGNKGCAAGMDSHIPGLYIRVTIQDRDIVHLQTQNIGHNLGQDCFRSLPNFA